ncbi:phosphotransferase [Kutzneria kofuensis]|uniref:Aminoglycoside phosphotransferase domain-containing protein n=1 Tax=Kutzneria kofuensis TaxID=103725 RepID=A0A7W9KPX5_9PSEU|nr:phosphotransferase [Kutzneria kofuensis]MBB5896487.1 hypothetical protein [Kutzneria kofuensis]
MTVLDGGLVDTLPRDLADRLAERVGADRLRQVRAASFKERSSNGWFRGAVDGQEVFVKLYARADRAAADRAVSAAVGPAHTTRLLGWGRDERTGEHAVFAWEDCTGLPWDARAAATAGRLLAVVHDTPPPLGPDGSPILAGLPTAESHYDRLLAGLAQQAPHLFARISGRLTGSWATDLVAAAQRAAAQAPAVVLHGDFSFRNIARTARGVDVVFDFERAVTGPVEQDLGRLWDRELAAIEGGHDAFVAGYRAGRAQDPGPFSTAALDFARLSCAVSTLIAARRTRDPEFEAEGLAILEALT